MIFNIQRFSTHDGAGIRTLLFFKGCPLRCPWCSNPESQAFGPELFFDPQKCIGCGECVRASDNDEFVWQADRLRLQRERLRNPEIFRDVCPAQAIQVVGESQTVPQMLAEIEKDRPFYRHSGGGLTISGGEPFARPALLHELLQAVKALDIHVAVETCLHVPWPQIERSAALVDVFLADLKHTDAEKFQRAAGGDLSLVLANLQRLDACGAPLVIRIPVIPGFNHTTGEVQAILDYAASLTQVRDVHLIPYHALGQNKYTLLGRKYPLSAAALSENDLEPYRRMAAQMGFNVTIGG